jgi:hypothetical protein
MTSSPLAVKVEITPLTPGIIDSFTKLFPIPNSGIYSTSSSLSIITFNKPAREVPSSDRMEKRRKALTRSLKHLIGQMPPQILALIAAYICLVTKIHFCNFIKFPLTPLDIIQALWHNKPVADNDEK